MLELPDTDAYDEAVARTEGIDRWCTSSDWVLPLTASMRANEPFLVRTDHGWGLFERSTDSSGRLLVLGVDRVWGFACPVVGPPQTWAEITVELADEGAEALLLPGLVEGSASWVAALTALSPTHDLHRAGGIVRRRARLGDGFDAWFGRRSARFRQRMRRIRRDAEAAGVQIERVDDGDGRTDDVLDRLIAIEAASWKGAADDGLCADEMASFYRLVLGRLGARTRCLVARLDGRDVGYVVGGVRDRTYRGLQLSHTAAVDRLGIGHLLQLRQIELLCDEDVDVYDLGMDMTYKRRWADEALATTVVAALPR